MRSILNVPVLPLNDEVIGIILFPGSIKLEFWVLFLVNRIVF